MTAFMAVRITSTNLPLLRLYDPHMDGIPFEGLKREILDNEEKNVLVYLIRCKDTDPVNRVDVMTYQLVNERGFNHGWVFDKGAATNAFAQVSKKTKDIRSIL